MISKLGLSPETYEEELVNVSVPLSSCRVQLPSYTHTPRLLELVLPCHFSVSSGGAGMSASSRVTLHAHHGTIPDPVPRDYSVWCQVYHSFLGWGCFILLAFWRGELSKEPAGGVASYTVCCYLHTSNCIQRLAPWSNDRTQLTPLPKCSPAICSLWYLCVDWITLVLDLDWGDPASNPCSAMKLIGGRGASRHLSA